MKTSYFLLLFYLNIFFLFIKKILKASGESYYDDVKGQKK
jgi:hypothetical protein